MNRPKSHQIDQTAQTILSDALPAFWARNELRQDYGIDYLVEIGTREGELSGEQFNIQLKGQSRTIVLPSGHVTIPMRGKHLHYYSEKIRDLPLFLIDINVSTRKKWHLFLQKYLSTASDWKLKKSHTLRIPPENEFSSFLELEGAIHTAREWMKATNSPTIDDLIKHKIGILEQRDPRFSVAYRHQDGKSEYHFSAREPVSFGFNFKLSKSREYLADEIGRGNAADLLPGELTISGSPLFADKSDTPSRIQIQINNPAKIFIEAIGIAGIPATELEGKIEGGITAAAFASFDDDTPVRLHLTPLRYNTIGSTTIKFETSKWHGIKMLDLPGFTTCLQLFNILDSAKIFKATISTLAESRFSVSLAVPTDPSIQKVLAFLNLLKKCRYICSHFNINPRFEPRFINHEFIDDVEQIHALLARGTYSKQEPNAMYEIKGNYDKDVALNNINNKNKTTSIRLVSDSAWDFFSEKIQLGSVELILTNVDIESIYPVEHGVRASGGQISFSIRSTAETELTINRISNESM